MPEMALLINGEIVEYPINDEKVSYQYKYACICVHILHINNRE